jgi:putative flippase GtrA
MMAAPADERVRFLRFAVVGSVGSAVDFGVMNALTRLGHMDLVPAGMISFAAAVLSNFLGNRHWTYPDSRSRPVVLQLGMFATVNAVGALIRLPILHFLEPPIQRLIGTVGGLPAPAAETLAKNFTLGAAILVVMLWNFFANRRWTYGDVDSATA